MVKGKSIGIQQDKAGALIGIARLPYGSGIHNITETRLHAKYTQFIGYHAGNVRVPYKAKGVRNVLQSFSAQHGRIQVAPSLRSVGRGMHHHKQVVVNPLKTRITGIAQSGGGPGQRQPLEIAGIFFGQMIHGPFQQRLVSAHGKKTQGHSAGDGCIVVPLHTRDIPLADDVNYLVRLRTIPYQVAHAHNGIRAEGIGLF